MFVVTGKKKKTTNKDPVILSQNISISQRFRELFIVSIKCVLSLKTKPRQNIAPGQNNFPK